MTKFEELGFTPGILKAIQELGFEQPMPVQEKVIPLMLGEDVGAPVVGEGPGLKQLAGEPDLHAKEPHHCDRTWLSKSQAAAQWRLRKSCRLSPIPVCRSPGFRST